MIKFRSNTTTLTDLLLYPHLGMEERGNSPTQNTTSLPPPSPSLAEGVGGSAAPTPTGTSQRPSTRVWTRETVPADLWLPDTVMRMSSCEVEADTVFSDILNRLQIGGEADCCV